MATIRVTVPIATASVANLREHWTAKHRRTAQQRFVVAAKLREAVGTQQLRPPYEVMLCRISPRPLDRDNLAMALKSVRDAVAEVLGLSNDRESDELAWKYGQERHGKLHAVDIDVRAGMARETNQEETDMAKAKQAERVDDVAEKMFRNLPVKLTEEACAERGKALAKATKKIVSLEAEKKQSADNYKGMISVVQGEASRLADTCDSGIEFREVEVFERRDEKRWEMQTIRGDTMELARHAARREPRRLRACGASRRRVAGRGDVALEFGAAPDSRQGLARARDGHSCGPHLSRRAGALAAARP
jgi:hypothetical protein